MKDRYTYYGTEVDVCVGDRVVVDGRWYGVVQNIIFPNTPDAELWQAIEGGVVLGINDHGVMTLSLLLVNNENNKPNWYTDWKTTKYMHRGVAMELPPGKGTIPWPYEIENDEEC